jgi:hypothetical protein
MPTAAVCMGPALPVAEVLMELAAELTDWVMLPISEVIESRAEPVAVESSEDRLSRALPALLVRELILEDAADSAEERREARDSEREAAEEAAEEAADSAEETADSAEVVVPGAMVVVTTWPCWKELALASEPWKSDNIPKQGQRSRRGWQYNAC